ncbi:hypothetical protein QBC41DRAFT_345760 [Cercophora samala]|uniref:Uncharacterized protein n=1 Tax=Cercophora samala TaxID=330535 RepID=A0AA40DB26_9PEZI|nr:hypothetical protein QBC41DRAFT_345760 [Cercophora samala]
MSNEQSRPKYIARVGGSFGPPVPTSQRPSSVSPQAAPPAQKTKPEDYRYLPAFEYVNLTKLQHSNPSVYTAVTSTPKPPTSDNTNPPKKLKSYPTGTLYPGPPGYTPQPRMSPSCPQHLCPICSTPIGHGPGQDFTGNLPCRHRGPCASRPCILAYYGSPSPWALPYTGLVPIYCRAPGCGAMVEAWCQVKCQENTSSSVGRIFHNEAYRDPEVVKAEEAARWAAMDREAEARAQEWHSEVRGERRRTWADRGKRAATIV